tara:strand:+ start:5824 stop:6666 length:843 start_codon:yes stop_codon:yes gene_type:complete
MKTSFVLFSVILIACSSRTTNSNIIGKFNTDTDLLLLHFDSKTDVDDIHSIAGTYTILNDTRFEDINYHAVAGAYGIQDGLYVPANELFEIAFGKLWSDAHTNYIQALNEVSEKANKILGSGGSIWIAEAGQSDFSADLIREIIKTSPDTNFKNRIHIVQHSDWNESVTSPEDLAFVKEQIDYKKIPDGNGIGNGTPGLRSEDQVDWRKYILDSTKINIWDQAMDIANEYNGKDGRYNNTAIAMGGLDFSDVSEICWIFGFDYLIDSNSFFKEFSDNEPK